MRLKSVRFTIGALVMALIMVLAIQNLVHARWSRGRATTWYRIDHVCRDGVVFALAETSLPPKTLNNISAKLLSDNSVIIPDKSLTLTEPTDLILGIYQMHTIGTFTETWNVPTPLSPGSRVFLSIDNAGNGAYMTVKDCTLANLPPLVEPILFKKENLNATLPPTGSGGPACRPGVEMLQSTLTVTQDVIIGDVTVAMNINHPTVSELRATLTSPKGTNITLFDLVGGSGNSFGVRCKSASSNLIRDEKADFILDDTSTFLLTNGTSPFNKPAFKPQEAFSQFAGENAQGDWTLNICDTQPSSNSGSLECWYLEIAEATYAVYLPLVIK